MGERRQELVLAAILLAKPLVELRVVNRRSRPASDVDREGNVRRLVWAAALGANQRERPDRSAARDERDADVRAETEPADDPEMLRILRSSVISASHSG
jgi:hypothetical protein